MEGEEEGAEESESEEYEPYSEYEDENDDEYYSEEELVEEKPKPKPKRAPVASTTAPAKAVLAKVVPAKVAPAKVAPAKAAPAKAKAAGKPKAKANVANVPAELLPRSSELDKMLREQREAFNKELQEIRDDAKKQRGEMAKEMDGFKAADLRNDRGRRLLEAIQREDLEAVNSNIARYSLTDLNYYAVDQSGMTCLHYATRQANLELVQKLIDKAPQCCNEITFKCRTPSAWSVLNCAADIAHKKDAKWQGDHAAICLALIDASSDEVLTHKTGFGTEVIHQLAARGHVHALKQVLPVLRQRPGKLELRELINHQVGPQGKGAVDTGLSSCMLAVGV